MENMSNSIELQSLQTNNIALDNNNLPRGFKDHVTPGNGACSTHNPSVATEDSPLLSTTQVALGNGQHNVDGAAVNNEDSISLHIEDTQPETSGSAWSRVTRELNEMVVWKLKVWMVIILVLVLIFIALVIGISLALCTVGHEDVDEKYDVDSFVVPRFFRGNFTLANQNLTAVQLSNPSSQGLFTQLRDKLADLYRSSPALGRYFKIAGIHTLRSGSSVVAQYRLKFLMPLEHEQLVRYTLSRGMVYSVLKQYLYDQDPESGDPLYIDPISLNMEVGSWK